MALYRLERFDRLSAAERGITIGDFLVPVSIGERIGLRVYHLALVVAGALLIYLGALVSFPVPGSPVPVTGQTFGVLAVGTALGFRRGLAAVLLYLAVGAIGIPAFAEHRAGLDVLGHLEGRRLVLGPTGGYLVGFALAGALVGRLAELGWDRHVGRSIVAMLVGSVVIYAIALPWLAVAASLSFSQTLAEGLVPFVLGDLVKIALAAGLFPAGWWLVGRTPGER